MVFTFSISECSFFAPNDGIRRSFLLVSEFLSCLCLRFCLDHVCIFAYTHISHSLTLTLHLPIVRSLSFMRLPLGVACLFCCSSFFATRSRRSSCVCRSWRSFALHHSCVCRSFVLHSLFCFMFVDCLLVCSMFVCSSLKRLPVIHAFAGNLCVRVFILSYCSCISWCRSHFSLLPVPFVLQVSAISFLLLWQVLCDSVHLLACLVCRPIWFVGLCHLFLSVWSHAPVHLLRGSRTSAVSSVVVQACFAWLWLLWLFGGR